MEKLKAVFVQSHIAVRPRLANTLLIWPLYSCRNSFYYLKNSFGRDALERIQIRYHFWRGKKLATFFGGF